MISIGRKVKYEVIWGLPAVGRSKASEFLIA